MATILIVEDDRNMRLLTKARLADIYTVVTACDGMEALDIIHSGGVDMVIADIMMPRMDGYELLQTIRDEGNQLPFLLLTAKESLDNKQHGFSLGTEYIELPKKEFDLLFKLLSYPDRIFSKEQLLDSIWGINAESGEETVKTHISRIRNRLKNITEFNIVTIKGLGYKADIKNG